MSRAMKACAAIVCGLILAGPACAGGVEQLLERWERDRAQDAAEQSARRDRDSRWMAENARSIEEDARARRQEDELRAIRADLEEVQRQQNRDRLNRNLGLR